MLAHILAIAVGLGSFALYMAAFFYPEVYRRNDFIWSGVGLFYALVLWVCAGRITGGVLLGQMAGVGLLMGLGWQLLELRREKTPREQQTEVSPQVQEKLANFFAPLTKLFNQLRTTSSRPVPVIKVEDAGEAVLETPVTKTNSETPPESPQNTPPAPVVATVADPPTPPVETPPEAPKPAPPTTVIATPPEKEVTSSAVKTIPSQQPANDAIAVEEIDDFWEDEATQEDKSEVPEPAIVRNLEDLTNLDRPVDNLEAEMTQSFESMVSEADLTASETSKKSE